MQLARNMCAAVDSLVLDLWHLTAPACRKRVDLLAVGGYGRGELAPFSDWDLWFLVEARDEREIGDEIQSFLRALWDVGAKVGHAVRSVGQTMRHIESDWSSATAAMETRLLCGSGAQFRLLQEKLQRFFHHRRKDFVAAKLSELEQRHQRAGRTAFLMEPDIKESPGGLRDVQTVFWMAKAWYGSPSVEGLLKCGAMLDSEYRHLTAAQDFLWRCRTGLHLQLNRAGDRLDFDHQFSLAEAMGYVGTKHRPAVEVFMKDYFRSAGRIARVSGMMQMHFKEQIRPPRFSRIVDLGDGFILKGGKVWPVSRDVFKQDSLRLLRVFHLAQEENRVLSSEALRQIRAHVLLIDDAFRNNPEANSLFLAILRHRRNVHWALKQMNDTGVLGRFIPEFRHAVGLGQFNRYHAYTVDEHTIRAIGEARNFWHGERGERLPLACEVFHRIHQPELLYLALLFHDIAKGTPEDHSIAGARIAGAFCRRLKLEREACELVEWLVRHHLLMALTSQRCDLSDPEVIRGFAEQVGDMGRLCYLFLLTVADIAAVGPNVWNEWKGTLLHELFRASETYYRTRQVKGPKARQRLEARKESALNLVAESGNKEQYAAALALLPDRCIGHFPPRQLACILRTLEQAGKRGAVHLVHEPERGETLTLVVAPDRLGLFADLTAVIASGYANVVAAQAFDLGDGRVLDVFHIQGPDGQPYAEPSDLQRLEQKISMLLEGRGRIPTPKPLSSNILMRRIKARARELPDASSRHTAIEVTAADRPGLLAGLARCISDLGLMIHNASISTFGERVVDVFFVTGKDFRKLSTQQVALLCARLEQIAELTEK